MSRRSATTLELPFAAGLVPRSDDPATPPALPPPPAAPAADRPRFATLPRPRFCSSCGRTLYPDATCGGCGLVHTTPCPRCQRYGDHATGCADGPTEKRRRHRR